MIWPSLSDFQIFLHFISNRHRCISVDADLHQSTPILNSRRRFYLIDAHLPAD
ncbi:hypothetical protein KI387_016870, partial [Taxus chinensis]